MTADAFWEFSESDRDDAARLLSYHKRVSDMLFALNGDPNIQWRLTEHRGEANTTRPFVSIDTLVAKSALVHQKRIIEEQLRDRFSLAITPFRDHASG